MARKFEYKPGHYAWNLEKCEEEIVIAAYEAVCGFIPADQKWKVLFEINFFDQGNGVSYENIEAINAVRRRHGLSLITIRETDVYEYGRTLDKRLKSNQRRDARVWLSTASPEMRRNRLEQAQAEAAELPPPHLTYEEYKGRQGQYKADSSLSFQEVTRRLLAQQAANLPKPPSSSLSPDRATRMLAIASPTLWNEIIPKLSADDALQVAETISDPELRDALVKHSLVAT